MTARKVKARCYDCKRPYGNEHGFPDMVVENDVWRRISPNGDETGLLCPSCICARVHKAGMKRVVAAFFSGPIDSVDYPTMYAMRRIENLEEREARRITPYAKKKGKANG